MNVYEYNFYRPMFSSSSYGINGYLTNNLDLITTLTGQIIDNDTLPQLSYSYLCNSSLIDLNIKKTR